MGHLEAAAAAASLQATFALQLGAGIIASNTQLRCLNGHLITLVSFSCCETVRAGFLSQAELGPGCETSTL